MLRLLKHGLRSELDHSVYRRRHVYTLCMSFYFSELSDAATRRAVLEVMLRASQAPSAFRWICLYVSTKRACAKGGKNERRSPRFDFLLVSFQFSHPHSLISPPHPSSLPPSFPFSLPIATAG